MTLSTIKQAIVNKKNLHITKTGYGTWKISCDYYGKRISTTTHDSVSVDNWNSDVDDTDQHRQNRFRLGYNSLIWQIIKANKP